jgi:hypothetical protein
MISASTICQVIQTYASFYFEDASSARNWWSLWMPYNSGLLHRIFLSITFEKRVAEPYLASSENVFTLMRMACRHRGVEYACTQAFSLGDKIIEPLPKFINTFHLGRSRHPDPIQVHSFPIELQQDPNFIIIAKVRFFAYPPSPFYLSETSLHC